MIICELRSTVRTELTPFRKWYQISIFIIKTLYIVIRMLRRQLFNIYFFLPICRVNILKTNIPFIFTVIPTTYHLLAIHYLFANRNMPLSSSLVKWPVAWRTLYGWRWSRQQRHMKFVRLHLKCFGLNLRQECSLTIIALFLLGLRKSWCLYSIE